MGLFINSQLQSLNIHKRLTELEKLSEISTGILALKSMVESGDKLSNRQAALENLSRILPMLSATQQKYVMEEIFAPLLDESTNSSESQFESGAYSQDAELELEGASSDYEMEFQLKLNKAKFDVKELNREQLDFRREQERERIKEERQQLYAEQRAKAFNTVSVKIEKAWNRLNQISQITDSRLKLELRRFIASFNAGSGRDHPLLQEAKQKLKNLP